jgi:transcriptional regulator with XRE-family HTH domain
MTNRLKGRATDGEAPTPTHVLVEQVKRLRRRRSLTSAALAARCAQLGAPEVTDHVVRNIEIGRRTVSVDQLAVLALALDVSPVHLLTPQESDGRETLVQVTTTLQASQGEWAGWVRGAEPLSQGGDQRAFWGYVLEHTVPAEGQAMASLARAQAGNAAARVMAQVQADSQERIHAIQEAGRRGLDAVERAARSGDAAAVLAAVADARQALSSPSTT